MEWRKFSDEELEKKLNELYGKLKIMNFTGGYHAAFEQCQLWIDEINFILNERRYLKQSQEDSILESGEVSNFEDEKKGVKIAEEQPTKKRSSSSWRDKKWK